MNEKGHVVNAVLLSVGISVIAHPRVDLALVVTIAEFGVPILAGSLIPDIDTTFGTHRKTIHNLPTLTVFVAFPLVFDNLHFVWIGVLTHYVLDLLGNVKGMAIFYPWPVFYDIPVGVSVDSRWADVVTILVSAVELGILAVIVHVLEPSPYLTTLRTLIGA